MILEGFGREPFDSEPFDTLRAVSKVEPLRAELLSRTVRAYLLGRRLRCPRGRDEPGRFD